MVNILSDHLCECGCGQFTLLYRGKPNKYVNGHNTRGKITKRFTGRGFKGDYEWRLMPWHPNANGRGRVEIHILRMTQKLGRPLNKGEVVHHIDKNPRNNDISNLMLLASQSEHMKIHRGDIDNSGRCCPDCGTSELDRNGRTKCKYSDGNNGWLCEKCYRTRKRKNKK